MIFNFVAHSYYYEEIKVGYGEGKRKWKHWNAGRKKEKEKEDRRQILVWKVKTSLSSPQSECKHPQVAKPTWRPHWGKILTNPWKNFTFRQYSTRLVADTSLTGTENKLEVNQWEWEPLTDSRCRRLTHTEVTAAQSSEPLGLGMSIYKCC